jgi:phosphosulfolactate phosphohydrolase-like enzyme
MTLTQEAQRKVREALEDPLLNGAIALILGNEAHKSIEAMRVAIRAGNLTTAAICEGEASAFSSVLTLLDRYSKEPPRRTTTD